MQRGDLFGAAGALALGSSGGLSGFGEGVFLDDYTVEQVEQALGRRLKISETDGYSLCDAIFRQEP